MVTIHGRLSRTDHPAIGLGTTTRTALRILLYTSAALLILYGVNSLFQVDIKQHSGMLTKSSNLQLDKANHDKNEDESLGQDWTQHYPIRIKPKLFFSQEEQEISANIPLKHARWVHECKGLDPSKTTPPLSFNWLHIPKTGTSFIIAYWSLAFPGLNLDYNLSSAYPRLGMSYDLVIRDRYPVELYAPNASLLQSHSTTHLPFNATYHDDYVSMLRGPTERVLSAYHYNMLVDGMSIQEWSKEVYLPCGAGVSVQDPWCFAQHPSVMSCMTKMLLGHKCSVNVTLSKPLLQQAIQNLKSFAFIGLMEEWNESICQFFRTFGGTPPQGAFLNVNKGYVERNASVVKAFSETYHDEYDESIYDVAVQEYKKRYFPDGDSQQSYSRQWSVDAEASGICIPRSCHDLGKQCGEWPDGCGGVRVCGLCSYNRTWLPDSWRLECSIDGQCIHTCPLWVQDGLWFKGPHDGEMKWTDRLDAAGAVDTVRHATEFLTLGLNYIPPTDAIQMCVRACQLSNNVTTTFGQNYCQCGKVPIKFLQQSPTHKVFRQTLDLNPTPSFIKSPANPALVQLKQIHSQPKCCKELDQHIPGANWHDGILKADYFATYDMGCGSHAECEALGRQYDAAVVVFCVATNTCHLGQSAETDVIRGSSHGRAFKVYKILK